MKEIGLRAKSEAIYTKSEAFYTKSEALLYGENLYMLECKLNCAKIVNKEISYLSVPEKVCLTQF